MNFCQILISSVNLLNLLMTVILKKKFIIFYTFFKNFIRTENLTILDDFMCSYTIRVNSDQNSDLKFGFLAIGNLRKVSKIIFLAFIFAEISLKQVSVISILYIHPILNLPDFQ